MVLFSLFLSNKPTFYVEKVKKNTHTHTIFQREKILFKEEHHLFCSACQMMYFKWISLFNLAWKRNEIGKEALLSPFVNCSNARSPAHSISAWAYQTAVLCRKQYWRYQSKRFQCNRIHWKLRMVNISIPYQPDYLYHIIFLFVLLFSFRKRRAAAAAAEKRQRHNDNNNVIKYGE